MSMCSVRRSDFVCWTDRPGGQRASFLLGLALASVGCSQGGSMLGMPPADLQAEVPLTGNPLWANRLGAAQFDVASGAAFAPGGDLYFTGTVQDAVDLGGGATPAAGSYDAWLGRYSPAGRHMWSRRLGGPGEDRGFSVAADRDGSVVVTGYFSGSVDFGGGSLSSAGQSDIFVAKYDPRGAHLWSRRLGGPGNDAGNHVAVDADGNVLVTGYFSSTADFAGTLLTSAGKNDIFLTKLSATGELRWAKGFGGPSSDAGLGVSVDAQGNVVCAGGFTESVDFGSGALTSAGRDDVFVASFDSVGRPKWSQRLGGAGDDDATGVAKNAAGEVFVVGYCHDAFAVGPTPVQSAGGADALLVKLSATGAPLWARSFGGAQEDAFTGLALDGRGQLLLSGFFTGSIDLGGGPLHGAGDLDLLVARLAADGGHLWSKAFGGANSDAATGIASDAIGGVAVSGYFQGSADFGSGSVSSSGGYDAVIARLAP